MKELFLTVSSNVFVEVALLVCEELTEAAAVINIILECHHFL